MAGSGDPRDTSHVNDSVPPGNDLHGELGGGHISHLQSDSIMIINKKKDY